ncbi:uncharacterized protein TNIN_234481 [Trichonephila inaurata madagascariensis]|uniref:Uncharacterized protein n=1 Tax=Trichonephila inaurata madagascariensis TaxID=2747483 RepID=A0A8X6JMZ8_9ARAC|nr:uncharacterized protein TNIN_234481 [Trichonephila inaurata madagascariensis]
MQPREANHYLVCCTNGFGVSQLTMSTIVISIRDVPWTEHLNEPHKLNQAEWSDLVRDLDLPKQKAELLASRLHQWNLLLPGVKITEYRTREKNLLHFLEKKEHADACIDVNGVVKFMNIML